MSTIPHVRFVDEDTYERLRLAESDQHLVFGEGDTFELISVLSDDFDARLLAKFDVLPSAGFVGLTRQGGVIASLLDGASPTETEALTRAAAWLAASETAVARRAQAAGAVGWLESLGRLSDPRDESGFVHA